MSVTHTCTLICMCAGVCIHADAYTRTKIVQFFILLGTCLYNLMVLHSLMFLSVPC